MFHIAVLVTTGTEEWQLCAGGCWCVQALTTHHYSHISPTPVRAGSYRAAFVSLANVKNQRTQTKPWSSFSIQGMAKCQLLLLCCLCFAQLHAAPEQLETGWSDGKVPAAATSWTVKRNRCQPGTSIQSWIVGEGDVLGSYAGSPRSVVSVQAKCSDGALLDGLVSITPPVRKQGSDSNSALLSAMGYHCSMLVEGSYNNNGGSRMVSFLKVGQNPAGPGTTLLTPIKLNCSRVPASYVAVGYSGAAEDAVGGVNFLMATFPTEPPPSASKSNTTDSAASPAPETKAPLADSRGPALPAPAPIGAAPAAWFRLHLCFRGLQLCFQVHLWFNL